MFASWTRRSSQSAETSCKIKLKPGEAWTYNSFVDFLKRVKAKILHISASSSSCSFKLCVDFCCSCLVLSLESIKWKVFFSMKVIFSLLNSFVYVNLRCASEGNEGNFFAYLTVRSNFFYNFCLRWKGRV